MWPEMANAQDVICYSSESERITHHLSLVIERLKKSPDQERIGLLNRLQDYASTGVFPKNYVHPYRNPIFIDPHGTACAVGYLMIESGNRGLAEQIDSEMEDYYLCQMDQDIVGHWASEHGFSPAELAWIQPGYPPSTFWTAPGGGLNGEVHVMTTTSANQIIVAGDFDLGGNPGQTQVASWDGNSYTLLGPGLFGPVKDLIEYNGQIYATGAFYILNAFHDLAVWDGSTWTYGNAQMGMAPSGLDLHIHNGALYAAGLSSGFAGISYSVMKLQGSTWYFVGEAMNDSVLTLETYDGALIAGGKFTSTVSGTSISHVAKMDSSGSWQEAYGGLNAAVHDLAVSNGTLYAGGPIGDTLSGSYGLAAVSPGSMTWIGLIDHTATPLDPFNGKREVSCLQTVGTQLFAGGSFEYYPLVGVPGQNIMWVDQGSGYFMMQAVMDGPVNCMAEGANTSLFVGGPFSTMNGQSILNIGWTDVSVMHVPELQGGSLGVWPSPSSKAIQVSMSGNWYNEPFVISDLTGHIVWSGTIRNGQSLEVDHLADGTYILRRENGMETSRFVISR